MSNTLITNYENFNFNDEFIPNLNIFNINSTSKVGIGSTIPSNTLDISNSANIKGNIIISNDILFHKSNTTFDPNYIHLLYKNKATNSINIGKLIYSSPNSKYLNYKWYKKNNNELYIDTNDNRPNTKLEYKSIFYTINSTSYNIDLLVHSKIFLKYLIIYNTSNNVLTNLNNLTIRGVL